MAQLLLFLLTLSPLVHTRTALIGTGDYNDLGWTWTVNQGGIGAQALLNTTEIDLIPNIVGSSSQAAIQAVADSGKYNLIIGTTFDHRSAIYQLAPLYPHIYWVANNAKTANFSNLGTISTNTYEFYYVLGFFSGCMSLHLNNTKIGMVVPGSTYTISTNTNMFYVGMKKCNPAAEMYMMWTGSLLNPDLAIGASEYLVQEIGVGQLSQQQDDFSVPVFADAHGMGMQGSTGTDLMSIFGQKAYVSVIRDWALAYAFYIRQVEQGVWTKTSYNGNLATGMARLSAFSYLVPGDVQTKVTQEVNDIITGKFKPYCGDVWMPVSPQAANGTCLSTAQINSMQVDLPDIHYVGTYVMPVSEVTSDSGFVIAFSVLTGIGLILCIGMILAAIAFRDVLVFRLASPVFCVLILIGALMLYVSVILRLPSQTDALCKGTVWMASLGFTFMYCYLIAKNFRIWRIFSLAKECQEIKFTNEEVAAVGGGMCAIDVLLLSLWIGVGNVSAIADYGSNGLGPYEYRMICTADDKANALLILIIAWKGGLLGLGCVLAYLTRKVDLQECNESQHIALCIYTAAFSVAVGIPTILTIPYYVSQIALLCSLFLFCTTATICILFVPKIWYVVQHGAGTVNLSMAYKHSTPATASMTSGNRSFASKSSQGSVSSQS